MTFSVPWLYGITLETGWGTWAQEEPGFNRLSYESTTAKTLSFFTAGNTQQLQCLAHCPAEVSQEDSVHNTRTSNWNAAFLFAIHWSFSCHYESKSLSWKMLTSSATWATVWAANVSWMSMDQWEFRYGTSMSVAPATQTSSALLIAGSLSLTVPVVSRCWALSQPVQTSVQSVLDPVLCARGVLHLPHSGSAET